MEFIKAAVYGITQGITEFLPISSSGHLVILHKFFIFQPKNELSFDVLLHLATLLAVCYYFRQDIIVILKDWFLSFKGGELRKRGRLGWFIIAGTIPAGIAGFLFDEKIENLSKNDSALLLIAFMLFLLGVIFIVVEKYASKLKDIKGLDLKSTLWIGFAQAFALIPGTSRSGITTITGMALGLKREEAVRFSFLLSVPIILGASIKKIPSLFLDSPAVNEWVLMLAAFAFAFVSGLLSIHYLLAFSKKYKLNMFAYYRFILALVLIVLFFWR
jgi:undecaprenyl-diphosphatase